MPQEDDDNGGWGKGPDSSYSPENILYVYRPDGERERLYLKTVPGASDQGRLFINDVCTGQRFTYTIDHVNRLLAAPENTDGVKERIVELLPRLSPQQKRWVGEGITDAALDAIKSINHMTGEEIETWRATPKASLTGAGQGRGHAR